MKIFSCLVLAALSTGVSAFATTSFPQCPAVGADTTGCELLINVTSVSGGSAVAFTVAASVPDLGPYDGSDDTLVGVQNSSGSILKTLSLSSSTDIFGFDGDGACNGAYGTISGCAGATDPSGYAPVGVTFSGVNSSSSAGTINFTPSLASGGSAWFSLEEALSPSQINPATPEPSSILLLGLGLSGMVVALRNRRAAK